MKNIIPFSNLQAYSYYSHKFKDFVVFIQLQKYDNIIFYTFENYLTILKELNEYKHFNLKLFRIFLIN